MWARIESGKVVELTEVDPDGRFHPSMQWVSCSDKVVTGMAYSDGKFVKVQLPQVEVTAEQVEAARLHAYADPITGSDRMFVEAARLQMMGDPVWEAVRDAAVVRYQEIQTEYPWP